MAHRCFDVGTSTRPILLLGLLVHRRAQRSPPARSTTPHLSPSPPPPHPALKAQRTMALPLAPENKYQQPSRASQTFSSSSSLSISLYIALKRSNLFRRSYQKRVFFASVVSQERVVVTNKYGEKLVGVLYDTGSKGIAILCHGFRSSKEDATLRILIDALTTNGIGVFCFDFSGNGESDGTFQFAHYKREADDLRAVVLYLSERKYEISAIVGHSKGGNVVLLYTSLYHDVPKVINLSGRFDMEKGIKERLGADFMQRIKKDGFLDVQDKTGKVLYQVTEESLMDRLNTDMHAACFSIDKNCRVLTVHGSMDEIIPVEDAFRFDKVIPNHTLHIIEGANHCYTKHQAELASLVVDFIKSNEVLMPKTI